MMNSVGKGATMNERKLVAVYRAKDNTQANLLRSTLENAGIRAMIDGDLLQGALGELPAGWASAPRIMVDEDDATNARSLLERWESSQK